MCQNSHSSPLIKPKETRPFMMRPITLTVDERAVLWQELQRIDLRALMVSPDYVIDGLRLGQGSGGDINFHHSCTRTAVEAEWYATPEILWSDNPCNDRCPVAPATGYVPLFYCLPHLGRHFRGFKRGESMRTSRITYTRLRRWVESLTPETRDEFSDTANTQDLHWTLTRVLGPEPRWPRSDDDTNTVGDQFTLF